MLREDDVVVLLGAGCSFKAGIPTSDRMLTELHQLLQSRQDWHNFHALYCHIRALILHADALRGKFSESFNIERLVAALGEIERRDQNTLYPFVNSFDNNLVNVSGEDFVAISQLRGKILERLKAWVCIDDYRNASYYSRFFDFANDLNYALRIFTLNYDLCLEKNVPPGKLLERGFDRASRVWDWRRFDRTEEGEPAIYYYKMHGSIDWSRDLNHGNIVREVDRIPDEPDLIFGTVNKLHSIDPYLFYAYEFRRATLGAKVILIIGYSFGDDYINDILRQSLENNQNRVILSVSPSAWKDDICQRLHGRGENQIITVNEKGEDFLGSITPQRIIELARLQADDTDPFSGNT